MNQFPKVHKTSKSSAASEVLPGQFMFFLFLSFSPRAIKKILWEALSWLISFWAICSMSSPHLGIGTPRVPYLLLGTINSTRKGLHGSEEASSKKSEGAFSKTPKIPANSRVSWWQRGMLMAFLGWVNRAASHAPEPEWTNGKKEARLVTRPSMSLTQARCRFSPAQCQGWTCSTYY